MEEKKCPLCGRTCSDQEETCVGCGYSFDQKDEYLNYGSIKEDDEYLTYGNIDWGDNFLHIDEPIIDSLNKKENNQLDSDKSEFDLFNSQENEDNNSSTKKEENQSLNKESLPVYKNKQQYSKDQTMDEFEDSSKNDKKKSRIIVPIVCLGAIFLLTNQGKNIFDSKNKGENLYSSIEENNSSMNQDTNISYNQIDEIEQSQTTDIDSIQQLEDDHLMFNFDKINEILNDTSGSGESTDKMQEKVEKEIFSMVSKVDPNFIPNLLANIETEGLRLEIDLYLLSAMNVIPQFNVFDVNTNEMEPFRLTISLQEENESISLFVSADRDKFSNPEKEKRFWDFSEQILMACEPELGEEEVKNVIHDVKNDDNIYPFNEKYLWFNEEEQLMTFYIIY